MLFAFHLSCDEDMLANENQIFKFTIWNTTKNLFLFIMEIQMEI